MSETHDQYFFEDLLIKFLYIKEIVREKITPYLDITLFDKPENITIIKHIQAFYEEYEKFPKINDTKITFSPTVNITEHLNKIMSINELEYDSDFLLNELEDFFKEKMISNVCFDTMEILKNKKIKDAQDAPDKLRDAFAFSFDQRIGLDVFNSEDELYKSLHGKKNIIPSDIKLLNDVIDGGFHEKSLTLFMAETNMGKSLIMSSLAVGNVLHNKNVLYISCELSEIKTAERALANLFDVPMENLEQISRDKFHKRLCNINETFDKKFIIKEYPSKSINVNHIRNLLKELELKLKFKPDIIYLDQIGNLNSVNRTKNDNTYTEMGKVTQEVRGLATETGIPFISAIQTNRGGFSSTEIDLTNTGDSIGFVQHADVVIGVTQSEELRACGKFAWIVLKNRYGFNKRKITVKVSYEKMRITNDDDAMLEYRNNGDKLPATENEKESKLNNAIENISNIVSANKEKEDKAFIDYD